MKNEKQMSLQSSLAESSEHLVAESLLPGNCRAVQTTLCDGVQTPFTQNSGWMWLLHLDVDVLQINIIEFSKIFKFIKTLQQ